MINPFIPQIRPYEREKRVTRDIVSLELVDSYVPVGKDGSFLIEKTVKETGRVDAYAYVQSFKDEVGILNILKKLELTEDLSLLNERHRPAGAIVDDKRHEAIQDYTTLPSNVDDAVRALKTGLELFGSLPSELVNNRSFQEFVQTATDEEIAEFVKKQTKVKEGDK